MIIGSIKQFMNLVASHLANVGAPRSCTKWKAFLGKGIEQESCKLRKSRIVSGMVTIP